MLCALYPCVEAVMKHEHFNTEDKVKEILEAGYKAADAGAQATKDMVAMAGRSTYLN